MADTGLQLRSTVTEDNRLEITLVDVPVSCCFDVGFDISCAPTRLA